MHSKLSPFTAVLLTGALGLVLAQAKAVEPQVVERIRANLLKQGQETKAPTDIKERYLALIRDESVPLTVDEVIAELHPPANGRDDPRATFRQGYVIAALFRFRDEPTSCTLLFQKIGPAERDLCLGMWTTGFRPFIDDRYRDVIVMGLKDSIDRAQQESASREVRDRSARSARTWLSLLVQCQRDEAALILLPILAHRVSDADLRFNLVAELIARAGSEGRVVADWYFERYAFRPFELQVLSKYMMTYMEGGEWEGRIAAKSAMLRTALAELPVIAKADPISESPSTQPGVLDFVLKREPEDSTGKQVPSSATGLVAVPAEARVSATLEQAQAHASFKVVNSGRSPVAIKKIRASCNCTTAVSDKNVLQPGETANISVDISLSEHTGEFTKALIIDTDGPTESPTLLVVRVTIPTLFGITAEPAEIDSKHVRSQRIRLKTAVNRPVHIANVRANSKVTTKLEKIIDGQEYALTVRWPDDVPALDNNVVLTTDIATTSGEKKAIIVQAPIAQN